jgi:hypothetical protein
MPGSESVFFGEKKESDNQHDHEFFACFLHGLFDEHRFFNTYPANEPVRVGRVAQSVEHVADGDT